ncbi:MAG TPA: hypothetical protein VF630_02840 [Hymenobacter sp.]
MCSIVIVGALAVCPAAATTAFSPKAPASQLRIQPLYIDKAGWPSLDPDDRKLFPVKSGLKYGK